MYHEKSIEWKIHIIRLLSLQLRKQRYYLLLNTNLFCWKVYFFIKFEKVSFEWKKWYDENIFYRTQIYFDWRKMYFDIAWIYFLESKMSVHITKVISSTFQQPYMFRKNLDFLNKLITKFSDATISQKYCQRNLIVFFRNLVLKYFQKSQKTLVFE